MKKVIEQNPNVQKFKEWVFYDGGCLMCINIAHRAMDILNARGIGLAPLQADWVKKKIAHIHDPLKEMLIRTFDGHILAGADAVIYLSRRVWWAYGLFIISLMPGMKFILRRLYNVVARNRYCMNGSCKITYNAEG